MFAQRKLPYQPRSTPGARSGYRLAPIRARAGLAMRRAMSFGAMPDAEAVLRASGLSLAPVSVGDEGLSVGGTSILATASPADIDSGALKALVVPAGNVDETSQAALDDLIIRAGTKGAPVFAFGEGVATTLRALGKPTGPYRESVAVVVTGDTVESLADTSALAVAAGRVG
ncbi:hypothetical protein [Brevundimonas aurifodinae]|uniref:Phage tail protein n=2 Tax=Brevundimonas TaxID=41275 RepID=A0ABV1NM72_9CAUL|nr:MAG: hypothetical protein B7Z42_13665 [Brevundimonas sp. 12-68-7]OYX31398.1 MAG: hypothetical protein B7Z01_12660 [Brevundimonas subvibrioides]